MKGSTIEWHRHQWFFFFQVSNEAGSLGFTLPGTAFSGTFFTETSQRALYTSGMAAVVVLIPVLFVLAATAINLAHMQLVNANVQIVADASARAAGRIYVETGSESQALATAQQVAALKPVHAVVIPIQASDLPDQR